MKPYYLGVGSISDPLSLAENYSPIAKNAPVKREQLNLRPRRSIAILRHHRPRYANARRRKTPIASLGAFRARRRPPPIVLMLINRRLIPTLRASAESRLATLAGSVSLVPYSTLALAASRRASLCRCKPHTCSQSWPTSSRAPRRRRAAPAKCGRRRPSKYEQRATSSRRRRPRRRPKTRETSTTTSAATAACASARRG